MIARVNTVIFLTVLIFVINTEANILDDEIVQGRSKLDTMTTDVFRVMSKAMGLSESKKSKRSPAILNPGFASHETGSHRLISVEPLFPLCEHPLYVDTTPVGEQTYGVCVSTTSQVTLGIFLEKEWKPLQTWDVESASKAVIFTFNKFVYILTSELGRADGTELLKYDITTDILVVDHLVHSQYPTTISLWTMRADSDNYHLAITNSEGIRNGHSGDLTSIFEWKGTYFDQYDSILTYDAKDVENFHIRGHAFLAVANHRLGTDNYHVDSEIFKYNIDTHSWDSFQRLRTYAAVDFQFFTLGTYSRHEYFLAVANQFEQKNGERQFNVNSVIYKFVDNMFVPFQCIPTHGATSIATYTGKDGKFLLVISSFYEAVLLYQYNGWNFVPSDVQYTRDGMGPGVAAVSFHSLPGHGETNKLALVLANPYHEIEVSVFGLGFDYENPLSEWYQQSLLWCHSAQHRYNSTLASELVDHFQNTYFIDQQEPIVVDGDLIFEDSLKVTRQVGTPKLMDQSTGYVLDHSILFELEGINKKLQELKERLDRTRNLMGSALRVSGDQIVTGELEFHSASFSCEAGSGCDVGSVETTYLNDDNISNLYENVIYLNSNAFLTGSLNVDDLHVEGDVVVEGLVSGVNASHLVTVDGHHKITSPKTMHYISSNEVSVDGLVNGLPINQDNVLLNYGDQTVLGLVTVEEIETQELVIEGTVNNINLNELYNDLVFVGQNPPITGTKILKGDVVLDDLSLIAGSTVNGVDLADLWTNAFWKNEAQEIYAPMNFTSLHLVDPSVSSINGISLNSDVVLIDNDAEIDSGVVFSSHTNDIDDLTSLEALNSIGIVPTEDYPEQMDLLLKSRDQVVYGQKEFPTAHLSEHSRIGHFLNDIDLANLLSTVISNNGSQSLSGEWVFNHVEFRGPVEFHGLVEGFELQELLSHAIRLDQPLPSDAIVVFKNLVHVDQLLNNNLNGIDISKDLIVKTKPSSISGIKHFKEIILEANSYLEGLINGIDLTFLDDTLADGRDQKSIAHMKVNGDLVVQDLFVGGNINGVPLGPVLTTNRDEEVLGPVQIVGNMVVENGFHVNSLELNGKINGLSFDEVVEDSMLFSTPQTVTGEKTFVNNLTVLPESNLEIGTLNGFRLRAVAEDLLLDTTPQMVTGKKNFVGMTHLDNLNFYGTIDGVSVSEMMTNWVLQDLPQTIVGDVRIDGNAFVNNDLIVGRVNGMHFDSFLADLVKLNEKNEIKGPVHVHNALFQGSVSLSGLLQGIDLSEEAVTRNGDKVIGGRKTFANRLRIAGDLNVKGLLDGVNIAELCSQALTQNGDGYCPSLVVNGDVRVDGGIAVGGLVEGLDLANFEKDVWKVNDPVDMENPIRFSQLSIDQPITLNGRLNGWDVNDLNENYLSLTKDQAIPSRITFHGHITFDDSLSCKNIASNVGLLNGMNLTGIANRLFKNTGDQRLVEDVEFLGDVHVLGDLFLEDQLGGVKIPEHLMLKIRPNVLLGPVIFVKDVFVLNDLALPDTVTVQRVDISEWAKNALLKHGHQSITGVKTFDKLTVIDARSNRHFSGINFTINNILTVDADQVLPNNVRFLQPVNAECRTVVGGNVNGVDLNHLRESVVFRDRPNVIKARTSFNSDLFARNMVTLGHVDDVNLSVIADEMTYPYGLVDLERSLLERQGLLDRVGRTLEGRPLMLLYYSETQKFGAVDVISWTSATSVDGRQFLFLSDTARHENGCSNIYVYVYSDIMQIYVQKPGFVPSSFAGSVASFQRNGVLHIAVGNIHPLSKCVHSIGGLQIYRLNPENDMFESIVILTDERVVNVEVIDFGTYACLIAATEDSVLVFFTNPLSEKFDVGERIPIANVKTIKHSEYNRIYYLTLMDKESVHVLVWDRVTSSFRHVNVMKKYKPNAITAIDSSDEGEKVSLLVVSEGTSDRSEGSSWVSVYDIQGKLALRKVQQITTSPVLSFDWIPYGNSFLLFVLCSDSNIHIYNWKGSGGFSLIETIHVKGSKTLHAIPCNYMQPGCHYLAISGKVCPDSWWQESEIFSILLKSKINGK